MNFISVVIPTYNAEDYIVDTLRSVLVQTHKEFEILVVDDCSSDSTISLVSELQREDDRVKLIPMKTNSGGPAEPRNVGIQNASGYWIAFLDADDLWHPKKLEAQLKLAVAKDADMVCSRLVDFKGEKSLKEVAAEKLPEETISKLTFNKLIAKNRVGTSSAFVKTSVLTKYSFNRQKRYIAVEDYKLWLELVQDEYLILKSSLPLVHYRILINSISRNKSKQIRKVMRVMWEACESRSLLSATFFPVYVVTYVFESIRLRLFRKEL